jgi:serine/threonine protein kinase/tetratricopeptide (TPR) repeat protein
MNEESLFDAALDKSTVAERIAFLNEACGDDIALRCRLERLLAGHEKTVGILDQPTSPAPSTETSGQLRSDRASESELAGTVVAGRYVLIEEIGEGGMGTVWLAEQTQPMRRKVALKLIKAGMDSKTVLSRFEAERQALALMEHPNIAKVLDGGATQNNRPFFVMEYVDGIPITTYCDDARLSIKRRLELFVAVCQAVQHAHTKGIIHRDMKPSNVLVGLYDGQPVPKVIDFGLAKAMNRASGEFTLQTAHGQMMGTPLYMSPEQAAPDNIDVDARTDVYALGVILYELLTGSTPLERQQFGEAAWHEILRLIREEEPPRPSVRLSSSESLPSVAAVRQLEPLRLTKLVRGELDWIVMKCLEKDRSRRYETANGLARDIGRYLVDESVEACPPSPGYRFGKFIRRYRGAVLAATLIFLLLIAGVVGTTWGLIRARIAWKAAAARARGEMAANLQAQKRLAQIEKGSELLASVFKDLDPRSEDRQGKPLRAILADRLTQTGEQIEGEGIGDPLVAASLQYRLGLSLLRLGRGKAAIPLFTRARATRAVGLGLDDPRTLDCMSGLAESYLAAGQLDQAVSLHEETLRLRKDKLGPDHAETLFSMNNLAAGYKASGRLTEAMPLLEETLRRRRATLGDRHPDTLNSMNNLAVALSGARRLEEAGPLYQETLKLREAELPPDHVDTLNSMDGLGTWYLEIGKIDQALPLLEETLKRRKAKLGADHIDAMRSTHNLSTAYRTAGKFDLALPLMEENVRRAKAKFDPDHPFTLSASANLAATYQTVGKLELALPLLQETATALEKRGFRHEHAGRIVGKLCDVLEDLNRFGEAQAWRQKWLSVVKKQSGLDSRAYAGALAGLGENLLKQHKWTEAEPTLREALAVFKKTPTATQAAFNFQVLLGRALLGQKHYAESEPLLIQGYAGLTAQEAEIPKEDRHRIAEAGESIVALYEAWGRPKEAAEWRTKAAQHERAAGK